MKNIIMPNDIFTKEPRLNAIVISEMLLGEILPNILSKIFCTNMLTMTDITINAAKDTSPLCLLKAAICDIDSDA